jgi:hypothetical protein
MSRDSDACKQSSIAGAGPWHEKVSQVPYGLQLAPSNFSVISIVIKMATLQPLGLDCKDSLMNYLVARGDYTESMHNKVLGHQTLIRSV